MTITYENLTDAYWYFRYGIAENIWPFLNVTWVIITLGLNLSFGQFVELNVQTISENVIYVSIA